MVHNFIVDLPTLHIGERQLSQHGRQQEAVSIKPVYGNHVFVDDDSRQVVWKGRTKAGSDLYDPSFCKCRIHAIGGGQ